MTRAQEFRAETNRILALRKLKAVRRWKEENGIDDPENSKSVFALREKGENWNSLGGKIN